MRIFLVVHGYPPAETSGTELYVAGLAQSLAERGHHVCVFAGSHAAAEPAHEHRHDGAVEMERFARPRPRLRLQWADAEVERAFAAALERFAPDVVHVHHLLGLSLRLGAVAREQGVPVVLSAHDHWLLCPEVQPYRPAAHLLPCFVHLELLRPRRCASMLLERSFAARARTHAERVRVARAELQAAAFVVAPSRFLRDRLVAFGAPAGRTLVVPNGLPPLTPAARTGAAEVRVGYLGPFLHAKGPDLLVRAFRGVRGPARLVLRGPSPDPRYFRRLRRLAARDPRIELAPPLAHEDVGAFLSGLDLLVVPSRFQESFSLVAHEALACRVPVLAARSGALAELPVPLFRAGSRRDLRARLRELVDEPVALEFPPVCTMDAHAGELAELYAAAASRAARGTNDESHVSSISSASSTLPPAPVSSWAASSRSTSRRSTSSA